jgi:hypothetical protein
VVQPVDDTSLAGLGDVGDAARQVAPQNDSRPWASVMTRAFMTLQRDLPEMNWCRPARRLVGRRTRISVVSIDPVCRTWSS